MENRLLNISPAFCLYGGQGLSAAEANHLFKIDSRSYSAAIDYASVLSEAELTKASRFYQQADRENYLIRKYALRQILAKFLGQRPAAIKFHQQANKKPAIANLHFNTSHTKNGIAIAISFAPIGIDIEYIDPNFEYTDILQQCFNSQESQFIQKGVDQRANFYTLWTRKEALLKATGEGLIDDLNQLDVLGAFFNYKNENYELKSLKSDNYIITTATVSHPEKIRLWLYNPS